MSTTDYDRPVPLDSKDDLDALVADHDRVLVEFHTDGCSICASLEPVLGNVARESDAVVATMNPRDDPVLVDEYDVRSVPKLLLFVDGELRETLEDGFVPTEDLLEFVGDV
ncbi:thioredoxin family protein [Halomicrobium urmianum]|uniref:thioredoxin family protein n=1 Tax=Halomicrobium urmianum TaxID=1586233 RepID=UPI001CD9ED73|nr:thioredoxin family protein [Halomicrobium urmianum]